MFTYLKYFIGGVFIGAVILLGLIYLGNKEEGRFGEAGVEIVQDAVAQYSDTIFESRQNAITRAVGKASPAVVGINVTQVREVRYRSPFHDDPLFRQFFPDRVFRQQIENLGSGFIISKDGYILTNEHVIHDATEIIVTMSDGTQYNAEIIGSDVLTDIGLLKIKGREFPFLNLWNSDDMVIGEWVIAIGNPYGLFSNNAHPTVTVGVISAIDRDFQRNQQGKLYENMIQTDASINPGNSGGPLVNGLGEVVGMNTMIFSQSGGSVGLGFAIPANKIKEIVNIIKSEGAIDRNYWIGISIQDINELLAITMGLTDRQGVIVTDIDKGSPANSAGMKVADIIIKMNEIEIINKETVQDVLNSNELKVGDELIFTVYRDGKSVDLKLELEPLP